MQSVSTRSQGVSGGFTMRAGGSRKGFVGRCIQISQTLETLVVVEYCNLFR
jgi:hypothetical protein